MNVQLVDKKCYLLIITKEYLIISYLECWKGYILLLYICIKFMKESIFYFE